MDADFLFPSIYAPSTLRTALARRQPTRDTGRAAAGRAGSFNSGKNTLAAARRRRCTGRGADPIRCFGHPSFWQRFIFQ